MDVSLTPETSAALHISEDKSEYHEFFLLQTLSLDNQRNQHNLGDTFISSQGFLPDQLSLQKHFEMPIPANTSLQQSDGSSFDDVLTSSIFQVPANITPSSYRDHDTINSPLLLSNDDKYHDSTLIHSGPAHYDVSSDTLFVSTNNR